MIIDILKGYLGSAKKGIGEILLKACFSLLCIAASLQVSAQTSSLQNTAGATTDNSNTSASFSVGMTVDGASTFVSTASSSSSVNITATLTPDMTDLNSAADIFVFILVDGSFFLKNSQGNYVGWDTDIQNLVPYLEAVNLTDGLEVDVFAGQLGVSVILDIYVAYKKTESSVYVYSSSATRFEIQEASVSASNFYTPAPIVDALKLIHDVSWTSLTGPFNDLSRFSMGPANSTDVIILTDSDSSVNANLSTVSGLASQSSADADSLLRSMFKLIDVADNAFRIVSTKHSNYALDVDNSGATETVILRDTRSSFFDSNTAAYLVFEISAGTGNNVTLIATGHKTYDISSASFVDDISWVSKEVVLNSGLLQLSSGSGTPMNFYAPAFNFDIPTDFNPEVSNRVSNPEVDPITGDTNDPIATTPSQIVEKYANQLAAAGEDSATTAAATAMITTIESTLEAEGVQMRYPAEFYLAFREGLFSRIAQSSDSTDGVIGQLTVPYVYFTNEADTSGTHHPFMVIASYGLPDSLALLWDVPRPPGDGLTAEYSSQSVTRSIHREAFLMKIPMRDYGEVESLTENIMVNDLASDVGVTLFDHHNYASVSATGVAIDGVVIYPSYNNSLHISQEAAELSAHGMHSGRGLGVHYHADAHSAAGAGLNLYNAEDYAGNSHPPIISIGFDGVAGYGIYQAGDTTSEGVSIALDQFGGHEHGVYAYHYHSFTQQEVTDAGAGPGDPPGQISYTAHMLPPLGAWAGRINDIPEFWQGSSPNYVGGRSVYLGNE